MGEKSVTGGKRKIRRMGDGVIVLFSRVTPFPSVSHGPGCWIV